MMSIKWNISNIPSQKGKTFLITGANSGLGLGTTKALVKKGALVVMAVRNLDKGTKVINEILQETPNAKLDILQVDLSDLNSVKEFAEKFRSKYDKLDVLINNAGIMMPVKRSETKQGFEGQFGTNHLGHFVLTSELFDLIEKTPNSRIVTLTSLAAKMKAGDIYWNDLQFKKSYDKMNSYSQSKLANMMFGLELDYKLKASGSKTISILAHPGFTATNLTRNMGLKGKILNFLMAQKLEKGILPSLRAATDTNAKSGEFYGPAKLNNSRGYPVLNELAEKALNLNDRQKLWKTSEELTNTSFQIN
jgi:NAD(P)-dependent dehydrogenase (short-subunit alcohol dehydrogenase family)